MKTTTLGSHIASRVGSTVPATFPDEEFELYSIPAHDAGGPEVALGRDIGSAKQNVQAGDILLAKIIPHIRRVRIVEKYSGKRQIASGEWIVLRSEDYNPRYLRHLLLSDRFHAQFMNTVAGVGGSLVRARPEFVKQIAVPLPPLAEQRRIAAILDQTETVIRFHRSRIEVLDTLTRSLFTDTFGPPQSWDQHWNMTTIGDSASSIDYGTSEKSGPTGGWPILRMGNLTDDGRLDLADLKYSDLVSSDVEKYRARRGDLLFNRTNSLEKVGKAAVVHSDEKLALAGYLIRVRFDQPGLADFVSTYLNSTAGSALRRSLAKAAVNQANISASQLRQIAIPQLPEPLLAEFANKLAKVRQQREHLEVSLAAVEDLGKSLSDRAFQGNL